MTKFLFILSVGVHFFIVIGNTISFFIVPFLEPPWVSIPIISTIFFLSFVRNVECPLTRLENHFRQKLGKNRIGGFVGHYFIRPIKRYFTQKH